MEFLSDKAFPQEMENQLESVAVAARETYN